LIEVPQYGYDWGYSKAYIELMCMDTTIIHYLNEKESENNKQDERLKKIEEAKRVYFQQMAGMKKGKENTLKINLKE
jgi:hypothetical protein